MVKEICRDVFFSERNLKQQQKMTFRLQEIY